MDKRYDTVTYFQTPEGVELSFTLSGPLVRAAAWLIDFGIRATCYIIMAIVLQFFGGLGDGVMFISLFLIEWFYPVVFEVYNGMTPGKKVVGIKVVHDNGTPVGFSSSLIRNLIRSIDFLPLFNVVGSVTMVLNSRFKRLGDIAAGTLVVYDQGGMRTVEVPEAQPLPAPMPLRVEEQRLILDFCERSDTLTSSRKKELAQILSHLTGDENPDERLLSYGNWFLKGKGNNESTPV